MKRRTIKQVPYEGSIPRKEIDAVLRAIHIWPDDADWVVRKTGAGRVSKSFRDRPAAERFARELEHRSGDEVILHHGDGRVDRQSPAG